MKTSILTKRQPGPPIISVCITSIIRVVAFSSIFLGDGSWVNIYPAIWIFVWTSFTAVSACLPNHSPKWQVRHLRKECPYLSRKPCGQQSGAYRRIGLTKLASPGARYWSLTAKSLIRWALMGYERASKGILQYWKWVITQYPMTGHSAP